jgi:hypothetical protein
MMHVLPPWRTPSKLMWPSHQNVNACSTYKKQG